jgi:transposase
MIAKGYRALFTPPYSPEFNPIEMIFGTIKNEFYTIRYDADFQTVGTALDNLIIKHGTADKLKNYVRHVTNMVGQLYKKAEETEGVFEASIQHPTHNISKRWQGVAKKKKAEATSPKPRRVKTDDVLKTTTRSKTTRGLKRKLDNVPTADDILKTTTRSKTAKGLKRKLDTLPTTDEVPTAKKNLQHYKIYDSRTTCLYFD